MKYFAIISLLFLSSSAYCLPDSDCSLSGNGNVYKLDTQTSTFTKDLINSYSLSAIRYPMGAGKYLYKETKTFSDGRPDQVTMFAQAKSAGSYNFSSPDGSLKSYGVCLSVGHCNGVIILQAQNFTGHMTTTFDDSGIRTVTFAEDGSFSDEVLTPIGSCP